MKVKGARLLRFFSLTTFGQYTMPLMLWTRKHDGCSSQWSTKLVWCVHYWTMASQCCISTAQYRFFHTFCCNNVKHTRRRIFLSAACANATYSRENLSLFSVRCLAHVIPMEEGVHKDFQWKFDARVFKPTFLHVIGHVGSFSKKHNFCFSIFPNGRFSSFRHDLNRLCSKGTGPNFFQ